jgi:hypothetical protein
MMYSGGYMRLGQGVTRWLIGLVLAAGAVGAAIAMASIDIPVRVPLVLLFLAGVPALAVSTLLGRLDRLAKVVVAGASVIVIDFAVAETMIVAGYWSPAAGVAAVALVSALIAAVGLMAGRRWRPGNVSAREVAGPPSS